MLQTAKIANKESCAIRESTIVAIVWVLDEVALGCLHTSLLRSQGVSTRATGREAQPP